MGRTKTITYSETWDSINLGFDPLGPKMGPVLQIGRAPELAISIPSDKSISRIHAEIEISNSDIGNVVLVRDLGSRFGTFVNGCQVQKNESVTITQNESILTIGGSSTTLILHHRPLHFCMTRLEKKEKDMLRKYAQLLGGDIVSQAEEATHVVCQRVSATIKVLVALAMGKKLVRMEWLAFAERSDPLLPIPAEDDFLPVASDEITLDDVKASRSSLMKGIIVILMDQNDNQYLPVLEACGAVTVSAVSYAVNSSTSTWRQLMKELKAVLEPMSSCCLFFDENAGREGSIEFQQKLASALDRQIYWLAVAQVARAVMTCTAPAPSKELPRPRSAVLDLNTHTEVETATLTARSASYSQLWSRDDPLNDAEVVLPEAKRPRREAETVKSKPEPIIESTEEPSDSVKGAMKRRREGVTKGRSGLTDLWDGEDAPVAKRAPKVLPSISEVITAPASKAPIPTPMPSSTVKEAAVVAKTSSSSSSSDKALPKRTASQYSRDSAAFVNEQDDDNESWISINKTVGSLSIHEAPLKVIVKPDKSMPSIDGEPVRLSGNDVEEEEEPQQPVVEERPLIRMNTVSSQSENDPQLANTRNVKRFVKNCVRKGTAQISLKAMDRVLPRESERELQLRTEFEALQREEEEAKRMMETPAEKPTSRGRRK
eukprot:scaffold14367_cov250-Ochromonas_danica.AAC.16